jgi:outer membrane receptor for ferrienterochelin and colicins
VDSASGAPISGAHVEARIARRQVEVGADGQFTLAVASEDTVAAHALGYPSRRVVVGPADSVIRIVLATAPTIIPELVVTTSRRAVRAGETAIPVTTVGHEEIAGRAAASVDKIVGELPGIQILPNAPTGADLSIRGIDGARVLVLVDGEPTPGNLLENRDLSRLSTVAVDRIEVVKGPLSSLYGSDALGGVVNLLTQAPGGPLKLEAQLRGGDFGRREAQLSAQAGGGVLSYRFSGGWREASQVASIVQNNDNALNRVWDFRSTLRVAATSNLSFRSDLTLLRERQRWQVSSDGYNGFNDNVGLTGWVEGTWQRKTGAFRARAYLEDYSHLFRQAQALQPLAIDSTPKQEERLAKGNVSWGDRFGAHALDIGMDLSHREIVAPGKVDGAVSDDMVEGYVQDGWTLGNFLITPAARWGWNSRWGTALTPSVAVAWDVRPALRLRASVGKGFRGPSFKELLWDFPNPSAGYMIAGNPDLVPEQSWQTSGGFSWAVNRSLVVDIDAYRNDIRNLIELAEDGTDSQTGLFRYAAQNVSRARTQGIEFGLRWTSGTWVASAGYNYLDAKDLSTGQTLDRRAAHSGRVRIGKELDWLRGLRGDLSLVYTGSAPAVQNDGTAGRQGALLTTNAQIRLDLTQNLGVSLGADNLFDSRPAGWIGILGRQIYAGIRTSWAP